MKDWNMNLPPEQWMTEELEEFLVQDYEKESGRSGEEIYKLAEELAKRKREEGINVPDVDAMWKEFAVVYYPEENQGEDSKEKFAKEISKKKRHWMPRYIKWVAAALFFIVIGVAAGNKSARAEMEEWMNNVALWAGLAYEKELAIYEKEVNFQATSEGYTLNVYKIAQTSTLLVVEYEVKDKNGMIVPTKLGGVSLASHAFGPGAYGCQLVSILSDGESGHSRILLIYDGTEEIDFTQMEGKTQRVEFSADVGEKYITFPEMEFVMEDIYPRTVCTVEKELRVEDYYYYVEEVIDEGVLLRVKVRQPDTEQYMEKGWLRLRMSDANGPLDSLGGGSHTLEGQEESEKVWIYDFQRSELTKSKLTIQAVFSKDVSGGDDPAMDVLGDKITIKIP